MCEGPGEGQDIRDSPPLLLPLPEPSYASYNYSAPRLPAGIVFSKTLRAVSNQVFTPQFIAPMHVKARVTVRSGYANL